jgi:integrase
MFTLSLFDETPVEETYRVAFERWLSDKRATGDLRQPASVQVYRDMWDAFMAWCLGRVPPLPLSSLTLEDLQAFQAARFGRRNTDLSLSPRHALRLVRLVDRVLKHHARHTGTPANLAAADWIASRPEVRFADAAQGDPLPEFLSVAEARLLISFVSSARPRPGLSPSRRDSHVAFTWQELRDRTAVALQLGGGLTPGDVRALTLASPIMSGEVGGRSRPRRIAVPGNGSSTPRETPLAPWAAELLQYWLQVRVEARIQGDLLFPTTRSGRPWPKEAQYRCAMGVLEDAGLDRVEGGSFQLRHTFALRQLRRGVAPVVVARWLGVAPELMDRYRRVLTSPVDVI